MNYTDIRFARIPFTQSGDQIHAGQAFYLKPGPNTHLMEEFEFFYDIEEIKQELRYGAPYECGECGRLFITNDTRRKHTVRYHNRKDELSGVDPKNYERAAGQYQDYCLDIDEKLTSSHLRGLVSKGKVAGNQNAYPRV